MSTLLPYTGNCRPVASKDAKYSIRRGKDGVLQIEIIFFVGRKEFFQPSTREHPALIEMVNKAKESQGGTFYINEFSHVLVPGQDGKLCCVGRYAELLEFNVSGVVVSAQPPQWLKQGEEWLGPHVGRPYVLSADCRDIYYKSSDGEHHRQIHLAQVVGEASAAELAGRLSKTKGPDGGRIYINERKQFFAPVQESGFLYLGPLGDDPWFDEPAIE